MHETTGTKFRPQKEPLTSVLHSEIYCVNLQYTQLSKFLENCFK